MQFSINVECTPEEARQFFGLPDVLPMQQDLMDQLSRRLAENIQTMEPETLMKTWVPALFQGWSDMQKSFWGQMSGAGFSGTAARSGDTGRAKQTSGTKTRRTK